MKRLLAVIIAFIFTLTAPLFSMAEDVAIREYEYVNGIKCKKRQNVLTYLFMGLDGYGIVRPRANVDDIPAQCDVLILLVIDKAADTYAMIPIDRNTIAQVHAISDYDGADLGTFPMQIALAHTNGDGMHQSCEIAATAVSDLLLGIKVDHYAAFNMDVIKIINESVGGVTVTIEDDFSHVDSSMKMGETIKLTNKQADIYIRSRMYMDEGGNIHRMRRQKQYLDAIKPQLMERYAKDVAYPLDLVHSMSDYMVSDMTDKDYSYIAKAIQKNEYLGSFEIDGTTHMDSYGWEAFIPDDTSITDIVTTLFYKVVDG